MAFSGGGRLNTVRRSRSVKINTLLRYVVTELAQRTDVIQNPERPSMRGYHKVVFLDDEVVYRGGRQVQFERPPVRAAIERNVNAVFGSSIEQSALLRVFADG